MKFKGTKGKWIIDENEDVITELEEVIGDIVCLKPEGWEESMENWEANALLISKAPEMLEAIIDFLHAKDEILKALDHANNSAEDYKYLFDNAEKLIKEATEI